MYEACDEAITEITVRTHPCVQTEHAGLTVRGLGVRRRASEDLAPVPGQALDMIWMAGVGEGMVQWRVGQAPFVVGLRKA